ncbi:hypothetical protein HXY33_04535 [Candidatus Bathyarchaeota archaeon]|nr:hypothetical protein [Candidatus Bathyarchaeota archaeon]
MGKIKEEICRSIPDEVKLKFPNGEITWKGIRERFCLTEPKETCLTLSDKVKVCILEDSHDSETK